MGHILSTHIGNLRGQWSLARLLEDQRASLENAYGCKFIAGHAPQEIVFVRKMIALTDTSCDKYMPVAVANSPNRNIEQIVEDISAQRLVALSCTKNSIGVEYKIHDYFSGEELFDLGEFACPTKERGFAYVLVGKMNPLLIVSPYHNDKYGSREYEDSVLFQMNGRRTKLSVRYVSNELKHHAELPDGTHLILKYPKNKIYEVKTGKVIRSLDLLKDMKNQTIPKINQQCVPNIALAYSLCCVGDRIFLTFSCSSGYSPNHWVSASITVEGLMRNEQLEKILFFDLLDRHFSAPLTDEIICVDGTPFVTYSRGEDQLTEVYDLTNPNVLKLKKNSMCERRAPYQFQLPPSGRHITVESKVLIDKLYDQAREFQEQQDQEEEHLIRVMKQMKDDRVKKILIKSLPSIMNDFESNERKRIYDSFLKK